MNHLDTAQNAVRKRVNMSETKVELVIRAVILFAVCFTIGWILGK